MEHKGIHTGSGDLSKDAFQNTRGVVIEPKAGVEYYSIAEFPNQALSPAIARKKCLSCGTDDLKSDYIYCPNCGLKFK